jgi:hypothetical protein
MCTAVSADRGVAGSSAVCAYMYDCRPARICWLRPRRLDRRLPSGVRLVGVAVMGLLLLVLALLVLTGLLLPARVAAAANRTVSPNILFFLADGAGQLAVHAAL